MAITSVARDPFARAELLRQSEAHSEVGASCEWCGREPRTLYRYAPVSDGAAVRRLRWSHPFCNLGCFSAFSS